MTRRIPWFRQQATIYPGEYPISVLRMSLESSPVAQLGVQAGAKLAVGGDPVLRGDEMAKFFVTCEKKGKFIEHKNPVLLFTVD